MSRRGLCPPAVFVGYDWMRAKEEIWRGYVFRHGDDGLRMARGYVFGGG